VLSIEVLDFRSFVHTSPVLHQYQVTREDGFDAQLFTQEFATGVVGLVPDLPL
jgi:hypothetical protein